MGLEEELRARMSRYEELRGQMDAVNRQLELLDHLTTDKQRARSTLEAIRKGATGDEVLLPVGGDTFLPVTLAAVDQVIVGIGANLATERSVEDALKTITADLETLEGQLERVAQQANALQAESNRIQDEMEALSAQAQEAGARPQTPKSRGG